MQAGGCAQASARDPPLVRARAVRRGRLPISRRQCARPDGTTLFSRHRDQAISAGCRIGFIGMTLKETATLVSPAGVAGLTFADEAGDRQCRGARAEGGRGRGDRAADPPGRGDRPAVITTRAAPASPATSCRSSRGSTRRSTWSSRATPTMPISAACRRAAATALLTSAGRYGTLVTDIRLTFAPDGTLAGQRAEFIIVQGEAIANARRPGAAATRPIAVFAADPARRRARRRATRGRRGARRTGRSASSPGRCQGRASARNRRPSPSSSPTRNCSSPATPDKGARRLRLDEQWRRARRPRPGRRRHRHLRPDFRDAAVRQQPRHVSLTGAQVKALLEQQFDSGSNSVARPNMLLPSANLRLRVRPVAAGRAADRRDAARRQAARPGAHLPRHGQQFPRLGRRQFHRADAGHRPGRRRPRSRCDRSLSGDQSAGAAEGRGSST